MSIRWKLFLPITGVLILTNLVLIWRVSQTVSNDILQAQDESSRLYVNSLYNQVQTFHEESIRQREILRGAVERRLHELVQSARGMLQGLYELEQAGALSRREAQDLAVEQINRMWFGRDGYFWIDDINHINVALPPNQAVVGTSRYDLIDRRGTYIVREFVEDSLRMDESWVEYYFPKPGETEPSLKLGHTQLFEPWGWVIGTGEYIDNIEREIAQLEADALRDLNDALYSDAEAVNYPFIIDGEGTLIAYVNQDLVGQAPALQDSLTGENLVSLFVDAPEGSIRYHFTKPGSGDEVFEKIGYIRRFPQRDWVIVYSIYLDEVLESVGAFRVYLLIASFIALLIQGLIVLSLVNVIQKSLMLTASRMSTIAQGSGDLTFRLPVRTEDEIGKLSGSFNEMMGKIQRIVSGIKENVGYSRNLGQELSASTEEISTAVVEMTATGQSIREKSSGLARETEKADGNVRQIIDAMEKMGAISQDESSAVEQSSAAVEEMVASIQNITRISQERSQQVRQLTARAEKGRSDMEMTIGDIHSIAESAGAIGNVLKVIEDISQRINLLAMNAAIEAAHAGDAGRGFAVVAQEIRKLAESTASNSAQIGSSVKEIVDKIHNTTERSRLTGDSIAGIARETEMTARAMDEIFQALNEVNQGTRQITEALEHLVGSSTSVRDAAKEVIRTSSGARQSLELVSNLSRENDQGIHEIARAMEEVSEALQQIRELGTRNMENISLLSEEVKAFKTDEGIQEE